jgi:hypothetical protein
MSQNLNDPTLSKSGHCRLQIEDVELTDTKMEPTGHVESNYCLTKHLTPPPTVAPVRLLEPMAATQRVPDDDWGEVPLAVLTGIFLPYFWLHDALSELNSGTVSFQGLMHLGILFLLNFCAAIFLLKRYVLRRR